MQQQLLPDMKEMHMQCGDQEHGAARLCPARRVCAAAMRAAQTHANSAGALTGTPAAAAALAALSTRGVSCCLEFKRVPSTSVQIKLMLGADRTAEAICVVGEALFGGRVCRSILTQLGAGSDLIPAWGSRLQLQPAAYPAARGAGATTPEER